MHPTNFDETVLTLQPQLDGNAIDQLAAQIAVKFAPSNAEPDTHAPHAFEVPTALAHQEARLARLDKWLKHQALLLAPLLSPPASAADSAEAGVSHTNRINGALIHYATGIMLALQQRRFTALSHRFINAVIEQSGDHQSAILINYLLCQHALSKACSLLNAIAVSSPATPDQLSPEPDCNDQDAETCITIAEHAANDARPYLLLMRGYSGTGKTTVSTQLIEQLGAIRLRSDVERKRLFADGKNAQDIYSHQASQRTFSHLVTLARQLLNAGWPVIIDATSLKQEFRQPFIELGLQQQVPFRIIECRLSDSETRARITARMKAGTDPSDATVAVYEAQLQNDDPLDKTEHAYTLGVDTSNRKSIDSAISKLKSELKTALTNG